MARRRTMTVTMTQCLSCDSLELCTYPFYDGAPGANCMYHHSDDDFVKSFTTEHVCGAWTKRDRHDVVISRAFDNDRIHMIQDVGKGIIDIFKVIDPSIGVRIMFYDTENTEKEEMKKEIIDAFDEWWDGM